MREEQEGEGGEIDLLMEYQQYLLQMRDKERPANPESEQAMATTTFTYELEPFDFQASRLRIREMYGTWQDD